MCVSLLSSAMGLVHAVTSGEVGGGWGIGVLFTLLVCFSASMCVCVCGSRRASAKSELLM